MLIMNIIRCVVVSVYVYRALTDGAPGLGRQIGWMLCLWKEVCGGSLAHQRLVVIPVSVCLFVCCSNKWFTCGTPIGQQPFGHLFSLSPIIIISAYVQPS